MTGSVPLFFDTNAIVAHEYARASRHDEVQPVMRAIEQFQAYEDQSISLTDHVIAVQADNHGIEHVFSYDGGFRTLGFSTLPRSG